MLETIRGIVRGNTIELSRPPALADGQEVEVTVRPSISTIVIVDRGRGPQLSTSRITVQDVVPYLLRKCSHQQIMEVMPTLTVAEIQAIETYVCEHLDEVMEQDRLIRERNAQRQVPGEIAVMQRRGSEKMASLREQFNQRQHAKEHAGDRSAG